MTELERRALMGDRQAQKECTKEGIVLPCPLCGRKLEQLITGHTFKCHKCGCVFNFPLDGINFGLYEFLEKINTRPIPPIGKCVQCKHCEGIAEYVNTSLNAAEPIGLNQGSVKEMLKKIKQLFCKHEFEKTTLSGFRCIDGWLIPATVEKCKKCGKVKDIEGGIYDGTPTK